MSCCTKLSEDVIITSSDGENAAIEVVGDDAVSTPQDNGHRRRSQAQGKPAARLAPFQKKRTSTLEPAPVNAAAKRGKQRAVERKASNQAKARVFKSVEVIDFSDSEGENPDFLTVRPMQRPRADSASTNCKVPSLRDCSFINCLFIVLFVSSQAHPDGDPDVFKLQSVPRALSAAILEPASPFPKRSMLSPTGILDRCIDPLSDPMASNPSVAMGSSSFVAGGAASSNLLAAPSAQALPCTLANDSACPFILHAISESAAPSVLHATSVAPSVLRVMSTTPPLPSHPCPPCPPPPPQLSSAPLPFSHPVLVREDMY